MRRHLSVLMLYMRSTAAKLLLILLVMTAAEGALFFGALLGAEGEIIEYMEHSYDTEQQMLITETVEREFAASLETVVSSSRMELVFAGAFLVLTAVLCHTGCDIGSKQGYTIRRLRVSHRWAYFWQILNGVLCYMLLLMWQALLAALFAWAYGTTVDPAIVTEQSVFIAFYREPFLHSLIPLEEGTRWARNIIVTVGMGAATAAFSMKQRRGGKIGLSAIVMAAVALLSFSADMGDTNADAIPAVAAFVVLGFAISEVTGAGGDGREA